MKMLPVLCDLIGTYRISLRSFVHVWDRTANPGYFVFSRNFYNFISFRKRGRLTTNQIVDLMEELDDSDQDPNYEEEETIDSEEEEDAVGRWSKPTPEIRVYMDPPAERPDGDTDRDSGKLQYSFHFFRRLLST
jgi:hypothetical protein